MTDRLIVWVEDDFSWADKCVDWDTLAIVDDLPALRDAKWQAAKAERDARLTVIHTDWGAFDADVASRTNLLGKFNSLVSLGDDAPDTVIWKLHDNTFATLPRATFLDACIAVAAGVEAIYEASFAVEAAVAAASDAAAIAAIDVSAGWPT